MSIVPNTNDTLTRDQNSNIIDKLSMSIIFSKLKEIEHGLIKVHIDNKTYEFGNKADENNLLAEIKINNIHMFKAILLGGEPEAGKTYVDQWWETDNLLNVLRIFIVNRDVLFSFEYGLGSVAKYIERFYNYLARNTKIGSKKNIKAHYDIGNDLYKLFLDENLMYSSAYFTHEDQSLEEASEYKLKLICETLQLNSEDHIIEIGSGWGGFAIYAAQNYGCHITTTTISEEQYRLADNRIRKLNLEDKITLLKKDYRTLTGKYDKLVSIEMIEAVGHKYLDTYFKVCSNLLKSNGAMLIQAITISDRIYDSYISSQDFIRKYVFPGGSLPSISSIMKSTSKHTDLDLYSTKSFAESYAKTLEIWFQRFISQRNQVIELGYPQSFLRLWEYYLKYCQAGFENRVIDVHQIAFKKPNNRFHPVF
ncbi:MAG: cyclopropane-fatty-acyl-phospholipid synthase family protein [Pseudomonadota bacterium]